MAYFHQMGRYVNKEDEKRKEGKTYLTREIITLMMVRIESLHFSVNH